MTDTWEDKIALNTQSSASFTTLGSAAQLLPDGFTHDSTDFVFGMDQAIAADQSPIPSPSDREGYYGEDHFRYWLSGLIDYNHISRTLINKCNYIPKTVLDFGCATGRLLRHYQSSGNFEKVYGCDINRLHIDWCSQYLPDPITVFQNTSLPILPMEDNSVDLITAFSVFTHIEAFEDTWLMELRRVLTKNGILWLTIHSERVWNAIDETWPIYPNIASFPEFEQDGIRQPFEGGKKIFRWHNDVSYSSNVFYGSDHIRQRFGRVLEIVDIFEAVPAFQDIVILRK